MTIKFERSRCDGSDLFYKAHLGGEAFDTLSVSFAVHQIHRTSVANGSIEYNFMV